MEQKEVAQPASPAETFRTTGQDEASTHGTEGSGQRVSGWPEEQEQPVPRRWRRAWAANLASATGFWSLLVLDLDEQAVVSSQHASANFNRLESCAYTTRDYASSFFVGAGQFVYTGT